MSNEVYANDMEIACKAAAGKSICAFPDVCFTPPQTPATPPGVPLPYPNTGLASDTTDGSSSVMISGREVMLKNKSYFKKSTGDEAGCAPKKGIISSKNMGKIYFNAWSMDVKVEGENVVRNLDLTTHNHGSAATENVPWPYKDAIAMDKKGHACQTMAKEIKKNCSPTKVGGKESKDYTPDCCKARKCLLVAYDPNACCNGPGKPKQQMTPHHLLPSYHFVSSDQRKGITGPDPATGYDPDKAPCICVKGKDHAKHTEHGKVGTNYTAERQRWLDANPGTDYTLKVGMQVAAKSAQGKVNAGDSEGCDEKCLEAQLKAGHRKMKLRIKTNDPLPQLKMRR